MILYLDTSALVKRYVNGAGSAEVLDLIEQAGTVGSVLLAHVEMAAALARAVRLGWVARDEAEGAWNDFQDHWLSFARLTLTPAALERAGRLAREDGLRAYDAVHLSAALGWQDGLGAPIVLATFDRELWTAAGKRGMAVWPED
ncbi:MAG TPA: type II toxin-antitoxin system VapC family toxin [Anaerolineales bacterium]|nr:type II toxin-antitoxin system VapC family toxin [Anaerolineales bacterium]